jgi:hypothetical protein
VYRAEYAGLERSISARAIREMAAGLRGPAPEGHAEIERRRHLECDVEPEAGGCPAKAGLMR